MLSVLDIYFMFERNVINKMSRVNISPKNVTQSIFDTSLKSEPALSSAGVQQSSELVTPCKLPEKRIRLYIGYV